MVKNITLATFKDLKMCQEVNCGTHITRNCLQTSCESLPIKAEAAVVKIYKYFCRDGVTEQQSCRDKSDAGQRSISGCQHVQFLFAAHLQSHFQKTFSLGKKKKTTHFVNQLQCLLQGARICHPETYHFVIRILS